MTYTQRQVARGQKLVASLSKCKWDLGDLAMEVMPTIASGALDQYTSPERTELERFADEIGLSFPQLSGYRRISSAFPRDKRRVDLSYAVHVEFAAQPERFKLLKQRKTWTLRSAREYLGRPKTEASSAPSTPVPAGRGGFSPPPSRSERVRLAREVLADEEVAAEVFGDRTTRVSTDRALNNARSAELDSYRMQHELDEPEDAADDAAHRQRSEQMAEYVEFQSLIGHARRDLLSASERWARVASKRSDDAVERMCEELDSIINAAEVLKQSVQSGMSSDDALNQILQEGGSR